jgi:hypothetical protein
MKLLIKSLSLTLVFFAGCGSFKTDSERWEGITDNTLRVTISEFFPFEENTAGDVMQNQIKDKLNQRASLIIASHLSINLARTKISRETDIAFNALINKSLSAGKLLDFECSENSYCTAQGEYNIEELLRILESINSR